MAITTVTKALRKLYKSVTGENTNKNSPTKIISDLADNWPGGGGSRVEIISLGEYSGTIREGNRHVVDAAPYPYQVNSSKVKEVIDSGKTIIGFACDCESSSVALTYVRYDEKDVIAHQFDTPFIEEGSKMFSVDYERLADSTGDISFNATLYAICI